MGNDLTKVKQTKTAGFKKVEFLTADTPRPKCHGTQFAFFYF